MVSAGPVTAPLSFPLLEGALADGRISLPTALDAVLQAEAKGGSLDRERILADISSQEPDSGWLPFVQELAVSGSASRTYPGAPEDPRVRRDPVENAIRVGAQLRLVWSLEKVFRWGAGWSPDAAVTDAQGRSAAAGIRAYMALYGAERRLTGLLDLQKSLRDITSDLDKNQSRSGSEHYKVEKSREAKAQVELRLAKLAAEIESARGALRESQLALSSLAGATITGTNLDPRAPLAERVLPFLRRELARVRFGTGGREAADKDLQHALRRALEFRKFWLPELQAFASTSGDPKGALLGQINVELTAIFSLMGADAALALQSAKAEEADNLYRDLVESVVASRDGLQAS